MDGLRVVMARLRGLFRRGHADRQLDDEIALHLELETAKNIQLGLTPDEARRRARVAFGALEAIKEAHRDGRGVPWIEALIADVRYAWRGLRRNPVLGGTAIITLAIGIGANTAIYSAVNAVILRPLPFADPGRLVMLSEENPEKGWHLNVDAPANVLDWKEQVSAFTDVAAYSPYVNSLTLTGAGDPRVLNGYPVTGNFFAVLGARATIGRTFTDAETWATGTLVAVISDRLWRDQFNADPNVLGRTVQLNARNYQVVGVMPRSFTFPGMDADVWTPIGWDRSSRSQVFFRRAHWVRAIARLKPGVPLADANAQLQVVVKRLQRDYPVTNRYMGAGMTPLQRFLVGDARQPLIVLLAAVALLLLIACANVGNLLLVQTAGRGREAALRLALGARRGRLLRQAFTESLFVSALGGTLGLVLGWLGTRALVTLQPAGMLPVTNIGVSWNVMGYVIAVTAISGVLFGIAPVLWNVQRVPGEILKDGGRGAGIGPRMRRWGNALVIGEIAFALLLTLGAVLLIRSFAQLQRVDPGFDSTGVLAVSMNIPGARYDDATRISGFYAALMQRVAALPGVRSVAVTSGLPLSGGVGWTSDFIAAGRPADGYGNEVAHRSVSPDYFKAMGTAVTQGRAFTAADALNGDQVVLINDALARSYFRGQNPVGQRISFDRVPDSSSIWRTIVGVVGDERQTDLATEPQIEFTTPEQQAPSTFMNLVVRAAHDPLALAPAIRRVVHEMDPTIGFTSVQTMDDVRQESLARQRFLMTLFSGFSLAGLMLAAVGVYGVMAHLARNRTREMGIRIALGAQATSVQWLVVREGLRLTALGVAIGIAAALAATRAMVALLYHVTPGDPVTFLLVPALLGLTALIATWVPAARASRADPMESLRGE